MTVLKLFIFLINEEEYLFESSCLILGWACIRPYPGIAALRCFRVFRLLWFYEVRAFRSATIYYMKPILGKTFVVRVFNVLKFAIKAITALIDEMLRLGHRTRGGIILIFMLFYTAYVMGIVLWVETKGVNENCVDIGSCIFTLMRLTFFDGNGFDFAFFLTHSHKGLFLLVIFYMLLTSFGILNGLVGIFGNVFANASEEAFGGEDEDDYDEIEKAQEAADDMEDALDGIGELEPDTKEAGDHDHFDKDGTKGVTGAGSIGRHDSGSSLGGEGVMPFSSEKSVRYFASDKSSAVNSSKVLPDLAIQARSPLKAVVESGVNKLKPTGNKLTYNQLKQMLDTRKQVKHVVAASISAKRQATTASPAEMNASPSKAKGRFSSAMNMFAVAGARPRRDRDDSNKSSSTPAPRNVEEAALWHEMQLMREEMRSMQAALHAQIAALAGSQQGFVHAPIPTGSNAQQVKSIAALAKGFGAAHKGEESMRPYTP